MLLSKARTLMKWHFGWALICVVGALCGAVMLRLPIVGKAARFRYAVSHERPPFPEGAGRAGYASVELEIEKAQKLHGLLRKPNAKDAPWILLFPGNTEGQLPGAFDLLERLRAGRDLGILTFNYRGFDGSDGEPSPTAAAEDARAQLRYLTLRHGVDPRQLTLVGYSMGSGIALGLAADSQRQGSTVRALLLLSPYSALTVAPVSIARRLIEVDHYNALEAAPHYRGPTLVLAGDKDEPLPIDEHARVLTKRLAGELRYLELAGHGHVDYLADDSALRPAVGFVAP